MEVIKEILRVVASKADVSKVLPEIDPANKGEITKSLNARYLKGLLTDQFSTDDDAAAALYGTEKADNRYRTLKSRTFERLLHSILFLQVKQPEHSEYLAYYYKCTRNLLCAQTLMRFASRTSGFAIAEKTLSTAEKYQFTDISVTLCKLLCETSAIWGHRHKFEDYYNRMNQHLDALRAEYRSDALLDIFALESNVSSRTLQHIVTFGESAMAEMIELEQKYSTRNLKLNVFRIRIELEGSRDNPIAIISACNDAIMYLEANPQMSQPARLGEFRLRKMVMQVQTQQVKEAHSDSDKVIKSFRVAGNNWYLAAQFATIAALRVGDYDAAERYIQIAANQRKFVLLDESRRESWTILSAYLNIADLLGLRDNPSAKRHFRLSTYLNSVPEESKKKKVANIIILISHVCFLILDEDFDSAEKRLDYTRVYIGRYLREKHFNRVRVFLRMLHNFPKHSFDPEFIREANASLYEQLKATQADHAPSSIFEYIQFETLYEGLLGFLEQYERKMDGY